MFQRPKHFSYICKISTVIIQLWRLSIDFHPFWIITCIISLHFYYAHVVLTIDSVYSSGNCTMGYITRLLLTYCGFTLIRHELKQPCQDFAHKFMLSVFKLGNLCIKSAWYSPSGRVAFCTGNHTIAYLHEEISTVKAIFPAWTLKTFGWTAEKHASKNQNDFSG